MAGTNELQQPKYVDFGEYILFQIQRTQSVIRQTDLLLLLTTVLVSVLFLLFGLVVLDHWAFTQGLSPVWRWSGFLSLLAIIAGGGIYFLRTSAGKNVSQLFAARTLEQADQRLANNLLTLVDLDHHQRQTSPLIRSSLEKRAALTLNDLDVEHSVDRKALLQRIYALLIGIVLLVGYTLASQKSVADSLLRILLPWTTISVPTETRIFEILPGSKTVTAGSLVEVSAFIDGKIPEQVWLVYSTEDRRIVDERIPMYETETGLGKYTATITGENGRGVDQSTHYYLQAGDGRSEEFVLSVQPAPHAQLQELTLTPPTYTKLETRTQNNGTIDALEGTKVSLIAETNLPVTKAWIQLYNSESPADRSGQIPLAIKGENKLTGGWPLKIRDDGTYPRFYRIECETADGSRDPAPPLHAVLIRPDERPEIRLLDPVSDLERPANSVVPLLLEAFDPDFRLSGLSVQVEKQGQIVSSELIDAKNKQALRLTHPLELSRLALETGETVAVWVEARDNREPQPNRRSTSRINIRITEPVTPEEVEQQRQADQQRQQEKLQERNAEVPSEMESADQQNQPAADPEKSQEPAGSENSPAEMGEEKSPESPEKGEETARPSDAGSDENESTETGDASEGTQQKQSEQKNGSQKQMPSTTEDSGEDAGEQTAPQSAEKEPGQKPKFSPDGQDDDRVLEKLIEKMRQDQQKEQSSQEQPNPDQPPSPEGAPDDAASPQPQPMTEPQPEQKQDPKGQEQQAEQGEQTKKPQPESTQKPDQPKPTEDAGSENQPAPQPGKEAAEKPADAPSAEKMTPEKAAEMQGEKPEEKPTGEQTGAGEKNTGDKGGDSEKKGMPSDSPDGQSPKTSEDTKPGSGTKPADNSSGPAEKTPATEPMTGEKQPAEHSGQGDSKPGSGQEQGPAERESDPKKSGPDAQKPLQPTGEQNPAKNSTPSANDPPENAQPQTGDNPPPANREGMQPNPSSPEKPAGDSSQQKQETDSSAPKQPASGEKKPAQSSPEMTPENPVGQQPTNNQETPENTKPAMQPPQGAGDMPPESADGEKSEQGAGQGKEGKGKSSDSAGEKSSGDSQGEGDSPTKPADSDQKGKGQTASQPEGSGTPSSQQSGTGEGQSDSTPEGGKARGGSGTGEALSPMEHSEGVGSDSSSRPSDNQSLEDRRKATDLVLQKLEEDLKRDQVDENLLKELGWNQDDLKQFQQRMSDYLRRQESAGESDLKRLQFEEMLKNIRLDGQRSVRQGQAGGKVSRDEFAPALTPAPPEYREIERAFQRSLLEQKKQPSR